MNKVFLIFFSFSLAGLSGSVAYDEVRENFFCEEALYQTEESPANCQAPVPHVQNKVSRLPITPPLPNDISVTSHAYPYIGSASIISPQRVTYLSSRMAMILYQVMLL